MKLLSLGLKNFRNYKDQQISFHPRLNCIFGKNAQGKTNILEAIYYLGYLETFREGTRKDLILGGAAEAIIEGKTDNEGLSCVVRIRLTAESREVVIDGKKIFSHKDLRTPSVILFDPREVYLFRESPGMRRRYLDNALALDDPTSVNLVRDYEKVVAQKNKILKEAYRWPPQEHLSVWNEQLVHLGTELTLKRLQWLERINKKLPEFYRNLSKGDENLLGRYFFKAARDKGSALGLSEGDILVLLRTAIVTRESEELRRGESLVGPHRDDWGLYFHEGAIGIIGSQGENRTALISLKTVQARLFEETHGSSPLFLLDDVASELDSTRGAALFSLVGKAGGQVFLSTTEPIDITRHFGHSGTSFLVDEGQVRVLS